jgi:hypothetical protein
MRCQYKGRFYTIKILWSAKFNRIAEIRLPRWLGALILEALQAILTLLAGQGL